MRQREKELQHHWSPSLCVVWVKNYPRAGRSANRNGLSATNFHTPVCGHEFTHTYALQITYLQTRCTLHISCICVKKLHGQPNPCSLPLDNQYMKYFNSQSTGLMWLIMQHIYSQHSMNTLFDKNAHISFLLHVPTHTPWPVVSHKCAYLHFELTFNNLHDFMLLLMLKNIQIYKNMHK